MTNLNHRPDLKFRPPRKRHNISVVASLRVSCSTCRRDEVAVLPLRKRSYNAGSHRQSERLAPTSKRPEDLSSAMSTIYCDEAGNSGENLLDKEQPVYVLASNDLTDAEASALLKHVKLTQPGEPKFTTLRKTESGVKRLLAFLADPMISPDRLAVNVFHKRFMVVTKVVDLIFETLMHQDGKDLYAEGGNIAMSNMMYACLPVFCGAPAADAYLQAFVDLMRQRTLEAKGAFYQAGNAVVANCKDEKFRHFLKPAVDPALFHQWFDGIGDLSLEPAVPALFDHIIAWGKRKPDRFRIVHDRSKPILASNTLFHSLMAGAEEEIKTIGYDRRQFGFPLKATSLEDGDSKLILQLQVADLCAGCINYFMKKQETDESDQLVDGIVASGCLAWSINAVLPGHEVTPDELGTNQRGGINPIEPMARRVARTSPE